MAARTAYHSPLRERQAAATRDLIVDAAVELMKAGRELTFAAVAQLAGVQERTVYRHFPSKDELEAALWAWVTDRHTGADFIPSTEEELVRALRRSFAGFEATAPLIRGMLHSRQGLEIRRSQQSARRAMFERCVASAWPHAPAHEIGQAAAALQVLYSAAAWEQLNDFLGYDAQAAADAVEVAVRAVFKDLRNKARSTRRREPG